MAGQRSAALLVVHDGKLRLERYGLGFDAARRWTSFSVAKSFTSTLVGAAVKDGAIKSLDDKLSLYIPDLKGSAYDEVSVRQLLTMTSGVKWNEDYNDPNSDVAQFNKHKPEDGVEALVCYMRKLPREAPAGTRWLYSTGETNLVGTLVQQATWLLSKTGKEIGGWWEEATTKRTGIGMEGRGYGYQWWAFDDGSYTALGIFGQGAFIDPKRKLVIVSNANWAGGAPDKTATAAREAFYREVQKVIDDESAQPAK
jgi:CubicO group peptidase (beta-lactamase class C family)